MNKFYANELDKFLEKQRNPDAIECKGIFFRYTCSSYISSHSSIEFRQSFRLLKRMSCSGCNKCQQIWEDFSMTGRVEETVRLPRNLVDNAIYEAVLVTSSFNNEGYCDDWWWELVEVKNMNNMNNKEEK